MFRTLVVDDIGAGACRAREALVMAGAEVVHACESSVFFAQSLADARPDIVVVETASPSRRVLEALAAIAARDPRPVVMFAADGHSAAIEAALRAGVTSYIVDGLVPARLPAILRIAVSRFAAERSLRAENAALRRQLDERKVIERAKGILMQQKRVSEKEAFAALRKFAMDRGLRLAEAAGRIVQLSGLMT